MEDLPLHELQYGIKASLGRFLDRPKEPNWRSVIPLLPTGTYKQAQVEIFAMAALKPKGSPTLSLLDDLGKKGNRVHDLITWLELLEEQGDNFKEALKFLKQAEPPCIKAQPLPLLKLNIGSKATLHMTAKGTKPLIYNWFKGKDLIVKESGNQLILENVDLIDSGYYTCRVVNSLGFVFSNWVKVTVTQEEDNADLDCTVSGNKNNFDENSNMNRPFITVQPFSITLLHGETKRLYCDSVGNPAPRFQWYKDNICITNETDRELEIINAGIKNEGSYFCKVSNEHGTAVSEKVDVTVLKDHGDQTTTSTVGANDEPDEAVHSRGLKPPFVQYSVDEERETATDKIALLIGNKDYIHSRLGRLYHPANDVRDVAGILQSIGFKVVSLINLRLNEMWLALEQFCSLLNTGMYAVFYFAGHGFEINGVSYLMPVDATEAYDPVENITAGEVLNIMQHRNTKLNVLLLDCCRTTPASVECDPLPSLSGALDVKQGNVLITFGCCSQGRVFESSRERNGFFAKHLIKYVGKDQFIEHVMFKVAKGIDKDHIVDPSSMLVQRVYRHSSLAKHISLCDALDPSMNTLSTLLWQQAHEIPEEAVKIYDVVGFSVKLNFFAEFSNSLIVSTQVTPGDIVDYVVKFSMASEIDGCPVEDISGHDSFFLALPVKYESVNAAIRISSLQRLKDDLEIVVHIKYTVAENDQVRKIVRYNVGKPLYARVIDQFQM